MPPYDTTTYLDGNELVIDLAPTGVTGVIKGLERVQGRPLKAGDRFELSLGDKELKFIPTGLGPEKSELVSIIREDHEGKLVAPIPVQLIIDGRYGFKADQEITINVDPGRVAIRSPNNRIKFT